VPPKEHEAESDTRKPVHSDRQRTLSSDTSTLESLNSDDIEFTIQAKVESTESLNEDDELGITATRIPPEAQPEVLGQLPAQQRSRIVSVEIPTVRSDNDSRHVCP
jgi:hypothetical protein